MKTSSILFALASLAPFSLCFAIEAEERDPHAVAREILTTSGVQGGLIVHLNCGDGRLTAALRPGDAYLVHRGVDQTAAE